MPWICIDRLSLVRWPLPIGFDNNTHNCPAPDISFVPKARLQKLGFKPNAKKFFPGAPDLAVEVLSPNNTREDMDARLRDFFASGTQLVWIIDPETESAEVWHSASDRKQLGPDAELEGENLLPGFRYLISNLFKEWGWD